VSWLETLRTGLEAVRTHRLRSCLTMLGILIGIAAVILTVGLGEGAQAKVSSQINALGSNLLIVSPGSSTSSTGIRGGFGSASTLTVTDAAALGNKTVAPDIKAVAPTVSTSESLTAGSTNWTTSVVGSQPDWLPVRARTLSGGRFINASDLSSRAAVVVLGSETAQELFGGISAVGQTVTINAIPFQVIGELTPIGSSSSTNEDDTAIVPITTAQTRLIGGSSRSSVSTIYLEAADSELLATHGITVATAADFTIATQQSILSTATSVDKTLTILLAGIAAISLLVGGIGVMNIMLVSVTERIREIGLRKALGAPPRVIRRQFLVESSVLGLAGGILGVGLGIIGAVVLPKAINQPITVSGLAAVGAIAVAVVIGVVFGVYPASRAARLAPIDALRGD
jgi:putative ABC transport system permease protein